MTPMIDFICLVSFGRFIFVIGVHPSAHFFLGIDRKNESILKGGIDDFLGGMAGFDTKYGRI